MFDFRNCIWPDKTDLEQFDSLGSKIITNKMEEEEVESIGWVTFAVERSVCDISKVGYWHVLPDAMTFMPFHFTFVNFAFNQFRMSTPQFKFHSTF